MISYLSTPSKLPCSDNSFMILMARLRWPISVIAKPKSHGKAKTTATQNSHGKIKKSRQNEKATAKQNSHFWAITHFVLLTYFIVFNIIIIINPLFFVDRFT